MHSYIATIICNKRISMGKSWHMNNEFIHVDMIKINVSCKNCLHSRVMYDCNYN